MGLNSENNRVPIIFAHRGASGYYVENTMKAFEMALEMGADGLESDVYTTAEGIPFLIHDRECRLPGIEKPVKAHKLHAIDLPKIILPQGERVPTLAEFFEKFANRPAKSGKPLIFSLDVQNFGAGKAIARMAHKYNCEEQVYVCHKFGWIFRETRKASSKIHIVASNSIRRYTLRTFQRSWSKYRKYRVEIFNLKAADFLPEYPSTFHQAGYDFFIWDLHDEAKLRVYLPYRPVAIYSNFPDLALRIRKEIIGQ